MSKIRVGNKLKSYWSKHWGEHGKYWKRIGNKKWRLANKKLCKKDLNEEI